MTATHRGRIRARLEVVKEQVRRENAVTYRQYDTQPLDPANVQRRFNAGPSVARLGYLLDTRTIFWPVAPHNA